MLNLLTLVSNIDMGNQMLAQNMGSEVTLYPCKDGFDPTTGNDVWHFSTSPCNNELTGVCVTACPYCKSSMPCDNYSWHSCPGKYNAEHSGNDNYPTYPNYPPTTGGGGGGTSSGGGGGGSSYIDNRPDEPLPQRNYDFYDHDLVESFGRNISSVDFQIDLKRLQKSSIGIVQNPSTCSAACIEKILLDINPRLFEQLATELYHSGKSEIGDLKCPDCMWKYRSNKLVPNTGYYDEKGSHVVDLLIQSALINSMNKVFTYDPVTDNGHLIDMGWQEPASVFEMLKKLFGQQKVTFMAIPSAENMKSIDYKKNYVIVLCNPNSSDDNYNLDGPSINLHYAVLTSFDGTGNDYSGYTAKYWSWHENHVSTKNNPFRVAFIIKK